MTNDNQTRLIEYVWRECQLKNGKGLFHGNTLARLFLGKSYNWADAYNVLRKLPDATVTSVYVDGISGKLFEINISEFYAFKKNSPFRSEKTEKELDEDFKRNFFKELLESLK